MALLEAAHEQISLFDVRLAEMCRVFFILFAVWRALLNDASVKQ